MRHVRPLSRYAERFGLVLCLALVGAAIACTPVSRRAGPFHPKTPGYTFDGGVVMRDGQVLMRVEQNNVDNYTTHYSIRAADGSEQAELTLASSYDDTLECRASFSGLGVHYEVRHPMISFAELLAAYIDNGVLVDGKTSSEGLQAYASSRGITLVDTAAQMERLYAAGHEAKCRDCAEDFRACQVQAAYDRQHPRPGLTITKSCESQFQACSQGGILTSMSDWPCGPAPAP